MSWNRDSLPKKLSSLYGISCCPFLYFLFILQFYFSLVLFYLPRVALFFFSNIQSLNIEMFININLYFLNHFLFQLKKSTSITEDLTNETAISTPPLRNIKWPQGKAMSSSWCALIIPSKHTSNGQMLTWSPLLGKETQTWTEHKLMLSPSPFEFWEGQI
jgi:hypothetical protein